MSNKMTIRLIAPILILCIVAAAYILSGDFAQKDAGVLNPAYYPRIIIYITLAMTVMLIVSELVKSQRMPAGSSKSEQPADEAVISAKKDEQKVTFRFIGLIALYASAMNYLGFIIATPLFLGAAMYMLKYRKIKVIIIVSLAVAIAIYFSFTYLLNVRFPSGIFK